MLFPLLVLLPLLIALIVSALVKSSMKLGYLAAGASVISFAMIFLLSPGTTAITWFTIGSNPIQITTTISQFNIILLAIVFGIGALIHLYSVGYLETLSEQKRFYVEMLAFEVAMATFAVSGNFILLFIAWEFLSLFSYLLIGFWHKRERATRAARLAITTVLIGDVALLAAIVIFWHLFGTFEFATIISTMSG